MNATLIELASLATAILLPSLVLRYLRPVLQGVLGELCPSPRAHEFWWRVVHVLGVSGSLLLVILCLGAQNLEQRPSLNLGFGRTAPLPAGFLVGLALVVGVLSGGCSAALLAPGRDQLPGRE